MRKDWQSWWRIGKALLALAIVIGVGWRFAVILRHPELWLRPLAPEWLAAGLLVYVVGLGFSALFWYWLLAALGEKPHFIATVRAYYIGHLGKYVPGKAWGLLLRTSLLAPSGIRPAVGALTATYETLTTMASGALMAAVLFALLAAESAGAWSALGLLALAGLPILPVFFNPLMKVIAVLAGRAAQRFSSAADVAPLPRVRFVTLLGGLVLTCWGWALLGLSLYAVLYAVTPEPLPLRWEIWGRCTAFVSLAWVAGFAAFLTPGGLGVRELILEPLLTAEIAPYVAPDEARPLAAFAVLLLRLLWTCAEIMMVAIVWWLPAAAPRLPAALPRLPVPTPDPGPAP